MASRRGQALARCRQKPAEREARFKCAPEWKAVRKLSDRVLYFITIPAIELIADEQVWLFAKAMKCQLPCGEQNIGNLQTHFG